MKTLIWLAPQAIGIASILMWLYALTQGEMLYALAFGALGMLALWVSHWLFYESGRESE